MISTTKAEGQAQARGVWLRRYLEERVLLTGGQVHLVLVVIHADVDYVCQQLLIAWDHFQLLMETLNSSARPWLAPLLLHPPPQKAHSWLAVTGHSPRPDHPRWREPASPPQSPHGGWSEFLSISHGRKATPLLEPSILFRGNSDS